MLTQRLLRVARLAVVQLLAGLLVAHALPPVGGASVIERPRGGYAAIVASSLVYSRTFAFLSGGMLSLSKVLRVLRNLDASPIIFLAPPHARSS
mgnify:CR=1 FL=1